MGVLRAMYPGARFLHIVRDPYVVFSSTNVATIRSGRARVSRTCPGRTVPIIEPSRSTLATIDIRNINP
jgi:hypothetical protein